MCKLPARLQHSFRCIITIMKANLIILHLCLIALGGVDSIRADCDTNHFAPSRFPLEYSGKIKVFNVYWSDHWDSVPGHAQFKHDDIDKATKALVQSGYFDDLQQYGVPGFEWEGGTTTDHTLSACRRNPAAEI